MSDESHDRELEELSRYAPEFSAPARRRWPIFWLSFFLVIIILALISTYALLQGSRQLVERESEPQSLVSVIFGNQASYLSPEQAGELAPAVNQTLERRLRQGKIALETRIEHGVNRTFAPALDKVPAFSEWYYSLQGEYSRYAHALAGNMAAYLEDKAREKIFDAAGMRDNLDREMEALNQQTVAQVRESLQEATQTLKELLSRYRREMPKATDKEKVVLKQEINLDPILEQGLAITDADITRQAVSGLLAVSMGSAVTKGLGAVVVKKAVAKLAGAKTFQMAAALLSKFAAKMALKTGSAGSAAAAGTAVCSPTGPVALLCGAVAGAITWVAVDKAFIEFDEVLHREEFEKELRQAIIEERETLKTQLKQAYTRVLEDQHARLRQTLSQRLPSPKKDFVPARELGKPTG